MSDGTPAGVRSLPEIDEAWTQLDAAIVDTAIAHVEAAWADHVLVDPPTRLGALVRDRRALLVERTAAIRAAREAAREATRAAQDAVMPAVEEARAAILGAVDAAHRARVASVLEQGATLLSVSIATTTYGEGVRGAAVARGCQRPDDDPTWSAAVAASRREVAAFEAAAPAAVALLTTLSVTEDEARALLGRYWDAVETVCYAGRA